MEINQRAEGIPIQTAVLMHGGDDCNNTACDHDLVAAEKGDILSETRAECVITGEPAARYCAAEPLAFLRRSSNHST